MGRRGKEREGKGDGGWIEERGGKWRGREKEVREVRDEDYEAAMPARNGTSIMVYGITKLIR